MDARRRFWHNAADSMKPGAIKKVLSLVIRLAVSAGLIGYVIHIIPFLDVVPLDGQAPLRGTVEAETPQSLTVRVEGMVRTLPVDQVEKRRGMPLYDKGFLHIVKEIRLGVYLPTLLLILAVILIDVVRWKVLLRVQGIDLDYGHALALTYGGIFCNSFMLGSTGGDVIKAVLVARRTTRKARAVLTVFLDRVIGLVALIIVAGAVIPFEIDRPEVRRLSWGVYGFLVAFFGGCLVYFHPAFRASRLFRWLMARLHLKVFHELDAAFYAYRGAPRAIGIAFGISFVAHMCGIFAIVGFGKALGITQASVAHYFVFFPIIAVISSIPISISGWGVGEAAFVALFGAVGVPPAAAVTLSILSRLSTLLVGLPGGLVFLLGIENLKVKESEVAEVERAEEGGDGPSAG